ncbi:hypothetical protein PUR28_20080 [Streptomyces sp. BE308]|uniref:hypothetical protein n=1 Tax=Streptomyces sp. BE308 TaxID=3002529 RepID=UPI002E7A85E4|nr:hypothetical protein [Streptomyces sp. BE308]MEE1793024.1 hypothetical protein [Streptomyces sp. BE308]
MFDFERDPVRSAPPQPDMGATCSRYFHACAPHTRITSLPAPLGLRPYSPVRAGGYLHDKMQAILG